MAAREKYEEELANEKREQQKKLLAQQEKSQNKQSEIDELRARRYAEERERKARNEEKAKVGEAHLQLGTVSLLAHPLHDTTTHPFYTFHSLMRQFFNF